MEAAIIGQHGSIGQMLRNYAAVLQAGAQIVPTDAKVVQMDNARMAVVLTLSVFPASQEQFNVLDDRVGEAMMSAGGPPAGLLSHVV